MRYSAIAQHLPHFLRRHILHFECAIEDAVEHFAGEAPRGGWILDAGAGQGQYAHFFGQQRYCGVDLTVGDTGWNYSGLDAVADITAMPFRGNSFDACLNVVTLEHVPEPGCALAEISRTLIPGGALLLVAPHEWEVHQAPHDYFRYTRHGLEYLLIRAGFEHLDIQPVGGYFRLLSRRLLNGLQFFAGGWRWIGFLPAAILLAPLALVLPLLDFLDRDRNFTLGYICTAKKQS
jgi:SAM-dependent methyltransferase